MTGTEAGARNPGLAQRAWTRVGAIIPASAVATILGCCVAAGLTSGTARYILVVAVLLVGAAGGLLWAARGGAEATHDRVAAVREQWARVRADATLQPDGPADPRDLALALPRGWRVEAARARLSLDVDGAPVRAETWVLRAVPGSRRARRRREVVATAARTGAGRSVVPVGAAVDSMLVMPRWAGQQPAPEAAWMPAVRERIARHDDLLAAVTIGDERVVLLALDDPRPETMLSRARLVRDVAAIIG